MRLLLTRMFAAFMAREKSSQVIFLSGALSLIAGVIFLFCNRYFLDDVSFVTFSLIFAVGSFAGVISQMADDSDIYEAKGASIAHRSRVTVYSRVILVSGSVILLGGIFFGSYREFGEYQTLLFGISFAVANWNFNMKRTQVLMRADHHEFLRMNLFFHIVRILLFLLLVQIVGQYAIFSEVVARLFFVPYFSHDKDGVVGLDFFGAIKITRTFSYATDSLVQLQCLNGVAMIFPGGSAAFGVLVVRIIFYCAGALSQTTGVVFNQAIFMRKDVSFLQFLVVGICVFCTIAIGIATVSYFEMISDGDRDLALMLLCSLAAIPLVHPLSRLFTICKAEAPRGVLQGLLCALLLAPIASFYTTSQFVLLCAIFSVSYMALFTLCVCRYKRQIVRSRG